MQAADRAHRVGQDKPVFVYKLVTEQTVEERILALQDKKRAVAEGVYGEGGREDLSLTAADLQDCLHPWGRTEADRATAGHRGFAPRRQMLGCDLSNRVPVPYAESAAPTSGTIFGSLRSLIP
jgi:hypothetical protein